MSILFRSTHSLNPIPNLPGRDSKGGVYSSEAIPVDLFNSTYSFTHAMEDHRCVAVVNTTPFMLKEVSVWVEVSDPYAFVVKEDIPRLSGFAIRLENAPPLPHGYLRVVSTQEALFYTFSEGVLHVSPAHRGLLETKSDVIAAWDELQYLPPLQIGWQPAPLATIIAYTDLPPVTFHVALKDCPLHIRRLEAYAYAGVWIKRRYPALPDEVPAPFNMRLCASYANCE